MQSLAGFEVLYSSLFIKLDDVKNHKNPLVSMKPDPPEALVRPLKTPIKLLQAPSCSIPQDLVTNQYS